MATVIVSGALANKPRNGGEAWVRLSWVMGFQRLGWRVAFVEQISRDGCVSESGAPSTFEDSANLAYFRSVTERFGLADASALVYADGEKVHGLAPAALRDLAAEADLLVNISGHLQYEPIVGRVRRRAYVDIDPGFTQVWHAEGEPGGQIAPHDHYFTIGENIGTPGCAIPTGEIRWLPIRQPVLLDEWPVSGTDDPDRFTTVASWRAPFGPIDHGGVRFGLKLHEFRKVIDLPNRVPQSLELALSIHPEDGKDLEALRRHGWRVVDPAAASADPDAFRRYVQGSGGEFSVAQGVYVETRSGWFSDRTVRYLASGKPVLVQDTGFSANLPVGEGLVAFGTIDEAVAGAERIASDYGRHCAAARAIAEEYFASDRVLRGLLAHVGEG